MPIVLGDEGSGIVDAVGDGCGNLKPGDHVIISWAPDCGACKYCALGFPSLCLNTPPIGKMAGGGTRFHHQGSDVNHYGPATYGPYIIVPEAAAVWVRPDFPLELAALIGCSVTTGFGSVVNSAQLRAGQSVAIFGCGGVGLNAIQGAVATGAYPIIGVDVLDNKLDMAREFGATHTINVDEVTDSDARIALVHEYTDGKGANVVLELAGLAALLPEGVKMLAPRGTFVEIGLYFTGTSVAFDPSLVLRGEKRVVGSAGYPHELLPTILEFLVRTKDSVPWEKMVSHRFPLDRINEALEQADWASSDSGVTRAVVVP
jgi:S-(hydroxymethyl)glutathione dehydrogenase/alcohol dehydrogenase